MNTDARIKNRIREYREEKKISQQTLAGKLNITVRLLKRLEDQQFSPGPGLMFKVCEFFNKELTEVFYIDK